MIEKIKKISFILLMNILMMPFCVSAKDFNETLYYDFLKKIAADPQFKLNPQTSVDEVNGRVAVRSGTGVYIYKESSFREGLGKPIYTFTIDDAGTQGDELLGNYFYTVNGAEDATIKKYDIRTGKKISQTIIDFTEFERDNGYFFIEPEGLTFNKNNLYLGLVTKSCTDKNITDTKCDKSSVVRYNSIIKITGI